MSRFVSVVLAALLVSACATDRSFGEASSVQITELTQLPAPTGQVSYTIGPREKLEIQVVGAEELSGAFLTDDSGNIFFPFLDEVETGGKSASEAAKLIADGLRGRYIRNPQVRIVPDELVPPTISIGGEVERPGAYPATDDSTLLRLVNQAEGLSEYAKYDDVLIMRSVDGQQYIGMYNLAAIMRGNYPDPQLYANDIVMVGDSVAKRRIETILGLVPVFTSSVVLLDRVAR